MPEAAVPEVQMPVEEASQETKRGQKELRETIHRRNQTPLVLIQMGRHEAYVDNNEDETTDAEDAKQAAVDEDKLDPEKSGKSAGSVS